MVGIEGDVEGQSIEAKRVRPIKAVPRFVGALGTLWVNEAWSDFQGLQPL